MDLSFSCYSAPSFVIYKGREEEEESECKWAREGERVCVGERKILWGSPTSFNNIAEFRSKVGWHFLNHSTVSLSVLLFSFLSFHSLARHPSEGGDCTASQNVANNCFHKNFPRKNFLLSALHPHPSIRSPPKRSKCWTPKCLLRPTTLLKLPFLLSQKNFWNIENFYNKLLGQS